MARAVVLSNAGYRDSGSVGVMPRVKLQTVSPTGGAPFSELAIHPVTAPAWRALDERARIRVRFFLDPSATHQVPVRSTLTGARGEPLPEPFAQDLAAGGPNFRAAFPRLARSTVAITMLVHMVEIAIVSESEHRGCFFGILLPTGRRVSFRETHRLIFNQRCLSEHRVSIDLRAIVCQLGSTSSESFGPDGPCTHV